MMPHQEAQEVERIELSSESNENEMLVIAEKIQYWIKRYKICHEIQATDVNPPTKAEHVDDNNKLLSFTEIMFHIIKKVAITTTTLEDEKFKLNDYKFSILEYLVKLVDHSESSKDELDVSFSIF